MDLALQIQSEMYSRQMFLVLLLCQIHRHPVEVPVSKICFIQMKKMKKCFFFNYIKLCIYIDLYIR